MENKILIDKKITPELFTSFFKDQEIANFFEKIYLSINPEEAMTHLLMILRKILKTDDVYIYNHKLNVVYFPNRKLKSLLNIKLLQHLMTRVEREHYINITNENNKFDLSIPRKVKSIVSILLKAKTKSLGMLLICNSPYTHQELLTVSDFASYFVHLITQKLKYHKFEYRSLYARIKQAKSFNQNLPVFFGEFLIESRIKLLRGDEILTSILPFKENDELFKYFNYHDIREFLKIKDKLYHCEDVSFTLKVKEENKNRWFEIFGTYIDSFKDNPIYLGIFIDITKEKELEEKLSKFETKLEVVAKYINDIIFEYDIRTDTFYCYGKNISSNLEVIENYLSDYKKMHPTLTNYQAKWLTLLTGTKMSPFPIKINHTLSGYNKVMWMKVESEIVEEEGKPVRVIGKLIDITEERENEEKLLKESRYDKVTKIYNKSCGEFILKDYLSSKTEDDIDSLMIIDIDNFSDINNRYGFYFGNEVLYTFAQYLKKALPKEYILYRHSSDHFIALLKGYDCARARDIAIKICEGCKHGYVIDQDINFSCSIGIVSTHLSQDLEELIKCADCALVNIKNGGKGFAANYFYTQDELKNLIYQKHLGKGEREKVDLDDNILDFAFELLRKTSNFEQAINLLFTQLSKKMHLSRIIILDIDQENFEAKVTHQYGENTCSSFILDENDFYLFKSGFNYHMIYQEKPYILTKELSRLISKSTLIMSLYEHHDHFGVIFFTQEQLEDNKTLQLISNIISVYLIREYKKREIAQKAELVMKLSHEIRTPLNGIKGMIRIAQGEINNKPKLLSALEKISMSSKYLLSLVNNILDLSRIQKGKMRISSEPFNLNNFIDDIDVLMRIQAEDKNIHFKVIKKCHNDLILGDALRLNQVLINLIGNAIKFTPENGTVIFKITELESDEIQKTVKFSVKDNGIGISHENLHRIFEAFEQENTQTVKYYGGTGLGLAISSVLVKMMGGEIEVKSEVNHGSEFYFTLTFPKTKQVQEPNWEMKFYNKRILVAEDNELNMKIITSFLDEFGCLYDTAINGKQVVDMFMQNEAYYYDLILMDVRMPIIDGFKATQMIRSSGKDDALLIPIIAMTANAFAEEEKASIECGMNAHLIKPLDIKLLYKQFTIFLK